VSFKPLVLFSGLTVGDYLLWNWSLSGGHQVIALVSGLTLPPLSVACLWLLVMGFARLLSRTTGHSARRSRAAKARVANRPSTTRTRAHAAAALEDAPASANARRLAA
jgi:hypothetical protein